MAKRKRKAPKKGPVWHLSAEEATMLGKPRYNGYACGHGVHGDVGYNRRAEKRAFKRELAQEKAPYRGLLGVLWQVEPETCGAGAHNRRCLPPLGGCNPKRAHDPHITVASCHSLAAATRNVRSART